MKKMLPWSARGRATGLACATLLSALALASSPARAQGQGTSSAAAIDQRVAEILEANPGSRRVSETSVLLKPGVIMTVPGLVKPGATMTVPAQGGGQITISAASTKDCWYKWLCLWQHVWRDGERLMLYWCGTEELSQYKFGRGGRYNWANIASSIWNNQTPGVTSYFYDYNLPSNPLVGHLRSGNYLMDLTRDPARNGGNWNDRIDFVFVC